MSTRSNVLPRLARPTRNSYRAAVASIITDLQALHKLSDRDLADRIGCSKETVANARNSENSLAGETLAAIEHEFGPGAVDAFLNLGGSRAVPKDAGCTTDLNPALALSGALHVIIAATHPNSPGGCAVLAEEVGNNLAELREARKALDVLINAATPRVVA